MADDKNIPAPPEAENPAKLKSICISGTDMRWAIGKASTYVKLDGSAHVSKVVGIVLAKPPVIPGAPPNFQIQAHIQFDDGYTDIIICEDHLVVKSVEVSAIAVPKKMLLVPGPRK